MNDEKIMPILLSMQENMISMQKSIISIQEKMATKEDLANLEIKLRGEIKESAEQVKTELRAEMQENDVRLRKEMNDNFRNLKTYIDIVASKIPDSSNYQIV